jgi:hypothetical protein
MKLNKDKFLANMNMVELDGKKVMDTEDDQAEEYEGWTMAKE